MRSTHGRVTGGAAIDPDAIGLHDGLGPCGEIGRGCKINALFLHRFATTGTDWLGESDLDQGCSPLVGSRQGAEGEVPLSRLASRAFGLGLAMALGEGSRLAIRVPPLLLELGLQGSVLRQEFLDPGFQRGELREQLSDERQECLFPQLCEFLERGHDADL